ncbi:MAG: WXG100 family type VII secretion target [Coriobacteriia bacterium]|nr:WXG100 family type VII secretion target [Coriobacteriia bacterium]MCL2749713.1 WXG100 family type VII secretion target [Coriobacteriia bacterium]
MSLISINLEAVKEHAAQYRNDSTALSDIIGSMDNRLIALQEDWVGPASQAYASKYGELKPGFESAAELIEAIAKALENVVSEYDGVDTAIAGAFNS